MPAQSISPELLKKSVDTFLMADRNETRAAQLLRIPRSTLQSRIRMARLRDMIPEGQSQKDRPERVQIEVKNGVVLVGGDGHYWPGKPTTAHRAFVHFCREYRPAAVIYNGDAFDGSTISRHPSIGWENRPTVVDELEAVKERLGEIVAACPRSTKKVWTLGNHDMRYESRLAMVAPEYARIHGFHLKDHFQSWIPGWSCWINGDVVVKHRSKGGTHATHNNTVSAGLTMVTNHLHSGKVTPFTDYRGNRYGVDTGMLADPNGPQFVDYSEDNARNHRAGFAVLTFKDGQLLMPELVQVWSEKQVQFRGELVRV